MMTFQRNMKTTIYMEDHNDKIMGANVVTPPWENSYVSTREVKEDIPVWVEKADTLNFDTFKELFPIRFTLEITETITEDLIIGVIDYDWNYYSKEWEGDIKHFIRDNYKNIQELTIWI